MKKIITDSIYVLKYLLVIFILSLIIVISVFLSCNADEIQRLKTLYSNFIIFYYFIIKLDIILYGLIPISLFITAIVAFFYAANKDASKTSAFIAIIFFCLIIFGSLYITFFQEPTRIKTIKGLYSPKIANSIPFIYEKSIVTYPGYQFYFENGKAYFFENDRFKISQFTINLNKNKITINALESGIGKDFPYFPAIGEIKSLSFTQKIIEQGNIYFLEIQKTITESGIYFIIYLFTLFLVICWIPYIVLNENWQFPSYIESIIITSILIYLFLYLHHFSIYYLKDLKLEKKYILLFPSIVYAIFLIFEILIMYIKHGKKIFKSKVSQAEKAQMRRLKK
ncbi:MAG: hypothetical protein KBG82_01050 [Spirochaetes bacterium]|nr:hypothetical protein [Spirochaetota bacterium]NLJ05480.1 hypothetical protein [Exilispira sp.]